MSIIVLFLVKSITYIYNMHSKHRLVSLTTPGEVKVQAHPQQINCLIYLVSRELAPPNRVVYKDTFISLYSCNIQCIYYIRNICTPGTFNVGNAYLSLAYHN